MKHDWTRLVLAVALGFALLISCGSPPAEPETAPGQDTPAYPVEGQEGGAYPISPFSPNYDPYAQPDS